MSLAGDSDDYEDDANVPVVPVPLLAVGPEVTPDRPIGDFTPAIFNPMDLFKQFLTLQDHPQNDVMVQDKMSEFTVYEVEKQVNIFTARKRQETDIQEMPTVHATPRCSIDYLGQPPLID